MNIDDAKYIYRLVGICVHRGSADRGHYWSLISNERGTDEPDVEKREAEWKDVGKIRKWRKFDD